MKTSQMIKSLSIIVIFMSLPYRAIAENPTMFPKALGGPRSIRVAPAMGAVSEQIPIMVSPGRRTIEPKLALAYSSMGGQSNAGLGWGIGIGRVERWRSDGTPTVGDPDVFLYSLAGSGGELHDIGEKVYRAKNESVYREFKPIDDIDGDGHCDGWIMYNGEGALHRFGGTPESRIPGQVWMLDYVEDKNGNTINYFYHKINGVLYPKEIRYTGYAPTNDLGFNHILFEYEERPDIQVSYGYQVKQTQTLRFQRISVFSQGNLVRRYEFEYKQSSLNGQSLLSRIILVGSDGESRITLRTFEYLTRDLIEWNPATDSIPVDFTDSKGRDTGARVSDVNGDGFADILYNGSAVYLGNGHGQFVEDQTWSDSLSSINVAWVIPSGDHKGADAGVRLMDVNTDGRPDIFIAKTNRREIWLNTGKGWSKDTDEALEWTSSLENDIGNKADAWVDDYYLGDPNDPNHIDEYNMIWDQEPFALVESNGDSKGVQLADINADGRVDILWSLKRSNFLYWQWQWPFGRIPMQLRGVYLNTGKGWKKNTILTEALKSFPDFVVDSQLYGYDVIDINGDGLADILRTFENAQEVFLNTGNGWTKDLAMSDSLELTKILSLNKDRKGQGLMPMDFDDDGLVDYLRADGTDTYAYHNTGHGWQESSQMVDWLNSQGIAFIDSDGKATGIVIADVDGDGISDFLKAKAKEGEPSERKEWLSSSMRAGPLVHATTALGEVTEINWSLSTAFDNQIPDEDGIFGLPGPMLLVTALSRHDGRGNIFKTTYDYRGGLFKERQFRGFSECTQLLPSGLEVKTQYFQEEGLVGQVSTEESYDAQGQIRSRMSMIYEKHKLNDLNVTQIRLAQTDQEQIDPEGVIHTRSVKNYDEYLNTISVLRDIDVNKSDDETTTVFDWIVDRASGVWSLPAGLLTVGPDGTVLGESVILYDGLPKGQVDRCLASQSMDLVEPGQYVSKYMEYDQYGNIIRLIDREGNMTQFKYDQPYAIFRTSAIDAENRVVMSDYDFRFGELARNIDASGNVTEKEYDTFGRLTRIILPGDEQSPFGTKTYVYSDLGDAQMQFYRTLETEIAGQSETLDKISYFDGMASLYRVEQEGSDGRNIVTLTEYDDMGNPVETSRPFFEGDQSRITLIERDERHRPVRVVEPDGIELTLTYAGPRTDVIDRRGTLTSFYKNAEGKTTEVHQWVDDIEQVTRYDYDPLGRLITIIDALGSETHITYDALGRRVRLEDPSAGTYEYSYDGEGNLLEQTAADGQITHFAYNRVGDLIRKEFPDGTTHEFMYGELGQNNAVGRMISMADSAGTAQIKYDARGNVIERRRSVLGSTYVTGYSYDSMGRIQSMMYPDGFIVYYDYDAGGNLAQVTDRQGQIIADSMVYTAAGQISQIGYGNGILSNYDYDDLLRMASIRTYGDSDKDIQSLDYSYDPGGNILAINDGLWGASQSFEYDAIGRLIIAQGAYGTEQYEYDAIGNLLRKGNLLFAMDPEHPQRVVQANSLSNTKSNKHKKPRSFDIDYDENGNVIRKADTYYAYDAENYLVEVRNKEGKVIEKNVYDALGQRIILWTPNETTIFIDGIYEQGKTHVSRHVRTDSLLLATVLTSKSKAYLVSNVPHHTFMHPGRIDGIKKVFVAMLLGLSIPLGGWSFRKGGWGRHFIAGLDAIGSAVHRRPKISLVTLLLIFSIFNNTGPIPIVGVGVLHAKPQNQVPSEKRYYYHSNHLGSINVVTDERAKVIERRDYKPYGDPFDWTGPNSGPREFLSTFNGQRYDDATGLYYFGARHYDSELGRFLTADTQIQDPLNPECLNRYAFAGGNPIRNVDPSGHAWWDWVIGILVIIAVIVVGVLTAGAGLALFGTLAGALLLTLGGAMLGAGAFAIVALANGIAPLSSDFWMAFAAGAVVGAAVGAMIGALPASLGAVWSASAGGWVTAGFFTGLAADVLVGAVLGGLGTVVGHFALGGGPEEILTEELGWQILTSVVKGALLGLVAGGILNKIGAFSYVGRWLALVVSAGLAGEGIWEAAKAGYNRGDKFSFLNIFGTDANWFKNSPLKGLGIPSWALSGTWVSSGRSEGGYLLRTLPLVP